MAAEDIGCSLAEAAESEAYTAYLREAASDGQPGMHVVYINTSLSTKALAHSMVPTITCTSSNVVATVLQVGPPLSTHRIPNFRNPTLPFPAPLNRRCTQLRFLSKPLMCDCFAWYPPSSAPPPVSSPPSCTPNHRKVRCTPWKESVSITLDRSGQPS